MTAPLTIKIPKDHPQAEQLVALAQKLATRLTTKSGLEIERPVLDPEGNQQVFIAALRDVCEAEGIDLEESVRVLLSRPPTLQDMAAPQRVGAALLDIFKLGPTILAGLSGGKRTKIINVAEDFLTRA